MTNKDFTISAEVNVQMENDKVYFVGEACTDDYVSLQELEDINQYFVNQPVIYRHDHPAKEKGGSIYGRVVESEIIEKENGTHALQFKSLMKQTLQKHKDLIGMAETQQELGKPIRYSVGFLSTNLENKSEADVYEVSITNDPVCEECENVNIMEKETMPKDKVEVQEEKEAVPKVESDKKEVIISELQNKFEESIDFRKELEKQNSELAVKVANYEQVIGESKVVMEKYSARLAELEKKADTAERTPKVEKIFALERNELMRERYMNPTLWTVEQLVEQYEKIKDLNKNKINARSATTRTLEQSRHKLMHSDGEQETNEFEERIKGKMSPALKAAMGWE